MGAIPTKPDPQDNPTSREWRRFASRTERYWQSRDPDDRANALAQLSRFRVAWEAMHGNSAPVVVPFTRNRI